MSNINDIIRGLYFRKSKQRKLLQAVSRIEYEVAKQSADAARQEARIDAALQNAPVAWTGSDSARIESEIARLEPKIGRIGSEIGRMESEIARNVRDELGKFLEENIRPLLVARANVSLDSGVRAADGAGAGRGARPTWRDIPGRAAYLWIYDEFVENAPQNAIAVEVGVALGKSAAYLARKCLDAGRDDIQIYAVDAWGGFAQNGEQQQWAAAAGGDFSLYCKMMLANAPEEFERIKVLRMLSTDAARLFDSNSVSLVVLDADHEYGWVSSEIKLWTPKIMPGGAIGGDDFDDELFPGVGQAVREQFDASKIEIRRDQKWPTWRVKL